MLYLRDLHSDIVGTVDGTSTTPLSRAYYSPWGEPTWEDGTSALGFQGQFTDPGTGFVDMTTRNYVPSLGRFASQDVVFGGFRHPLSLNQWAYAEGDPVTNADPLGLGVTKDADPPDGCVGNCASGDIEPSEHGGDPPTSSVGDSGTGNSNADVVVDAFSYFLTGTGTGAYKTSGYLRAQAAALDAAASCHAACVEALWAVTLEAGTDTDSSIYGRAYQAAALRDASRVAGDQGSLLSRLGGRAKVAGKLFGWAGFGLQVVENADEYGAAGSVAIATGSTAGGVAGAWVGAQVGIGCGFFAIVCVPVFATTFGVAGSWGGGEATKHVLDNLPPVPGYQDRARGLVCLAYLRC